MYSLNIILDNLQREYTQAIVSDTFAISIPSDEIAYLAEIFLHTEWHPCLKIISLDMDAVYLPFLPTLFIHEMSQKHFGVPDTASNTFYNNCYSNPAIPF